MKPARQVADLAEFRRSRVKKVVQNYLGMLRLYTLVDLILQLLAVHAGARDMVGATGLWVGFLAYLEWLHRDRGRLAVPAWLWVGLWGFGLGAYFRPEGIVFCALSLIYAAKIFPFFGLISPMMRGMQNWILLGGIGGYQTWLVWAAFGLTGLRNLVGDWRDLDKDRERGTKTIPLALGFTREWPRAHLWAVHATTFVWWLATPIPWWGLVAAWVIQRLTYDLTPR